jgi:hypothetical protein
MLIRLFKTKWFARFARKEGLGDQSLREAMERADRGIIDADLGGGLIKQRVAREGRGRSGGYRVLVAYRHQERAVFLYGFAKNARNSIDSDELASLQELGAAWLAADRKQMKVAIKAKELREIGDGEAED